MSSNKGGEQQGPGGDHGGHNNDVTLDIATPNGLFKGTFGKNTKVIDVIETVIRDMHLDNKDGFELVKGETVLQPVERPLVSFGLQGTVKLELVATGSGV